VTQDEPGKLLSGGSMTLNATQIANQQSKIVAGGLLTTNGATIDNQEVNSQERVRDVGTQWSWGVVGGHSEGPWYDRHWVYDWGMVASGYDNTVTTPTTVSAGASASNSSAGAVVTTQARSTASAPAGASTSTVLNNALFHNTTNPAANYLIETDPRFANMRSWLGSDYMLRSLALDPSVTQKRLGDGFYEQRLINEQVNNLTGRRFLGNYTNDEQQYQALMDAGVTYAKAQNLRPGIALTAAQVANLTSDIVWLVEKEVILKDGSKQKVLVPQVYAMVREGDLSNTGALLSGNSVSINTTADAKNSGTILGRKLVQISANNIQNTDGTVQGDNVSLSATQNITNTRGTFAAQNSLQAVAGGDINLQTTTSKSGDDANGRTVLDRQARVYVGNSTSGSQPGDLLLAAAGNINLGAARIETTGNATLQAGGSINLNAVTTGENVLFEGTGDAQYRQRIRNTDQTGSSIKTQGNATLNAGANIVGTAAQVSAQGDVAITAGQSIALLAGQKTRESDLSWTSKSFGDFTATVTNTRIQDSSATAQVSKVEGKNLGIVADKDLVSVGTQFKGTDSVRVEGKDTSTFYAATDVQQRTTTVRSKTTVGPLLSNFMDPLGLGMPLEDKTSTDARASSVSIGTKLVSNQKIEIGVGNKTELQGTQVEAPQIVFVKTDPTKAGELILGASKDTTQTSHTEKSETAGVWQEQKGQGSTTQTLNQTLISGNVTFDNALKITVQIPKDVQATPGGKALQGQLQELSNSSLASTPQGLAYLEQLKANPNVKWDQIALANEKWSYSQAGLTPAGAALLSIAVAAYAPGLSTGITSAVGGGSIATGLNAGFIALQSQAAVAMVNNGGDIGKTLEQLGSEQSIKNLLTVMVTAGALSNLNQTLGFNGQSGPGASGTNGITTTQAANQFTNNLLKNVTNNVAGAALDSAINGKAFDEKTLSAALSSALITAGMAKGANVIGDADLNSFTNKLAHAALGCAGGAAMGGSCKSGAVGAVVGELAAEYINPNADPALKEQTLAFAKTMAAVAGVIVGGGEQLARGSPKGSHEARDGCSQEQC
jgi:adhesin HecA-like repeat protein